MLMHIAQFAAQAVVPTEPNWMPLIIILGIIAFIAILLLIPSKDMKAIEDAEKKSQKALKSDEEKKALPDLDEKTDKDNLSLAEIKEAKRAAVTESKSKEELRELRKERRAATQTEKAIQEREEAQSEEKSADDVAEKAAEPEKIEMKSDEKSAVSEKPAESVKSEDEKKEEAGILSSSAEILADSSADSGDLFASLFGDSKENSLSFDDELSGGTPNLDDGTLFPTLGSALIPLNEFTKAASEDDASSNNPLDELTKRLSDKAEKKNSGVSEEKVSGSVPDTSAENHDVSAKTEKKPQKVSKSSEKNVKIDEKPQEIQESAKAVSSSKGRSLNDGLEATRSKGFLAQLGKIFKGELKKSVYDELEEILFTADIGVQTSERLLDKVTENLKDKGDGAAAMQLLREEVESILSACEKPFEVGPSKPHVILTIGVNGAGKTTTLGKLAAQLMQQGKKVLLIAGDTFRAAAIEQLEEWGQRCGCEVFCRKQGADPSGTIFAGIEYARENGFDVALADTAGRLQNKKELIEELKKIHRVCGKAMSGAPHEILLVLDATNGQNALMQAKEFGEAIDFTGIALTKLDGTAKGGVIIGICEEFRKPVYFIGIGEMTEDLRRFEASEFVDALFLES